MFLHHFFDDFILFLFLLGCQTFWIHHPIFFLLSICLSFSCSEIPSTLFLNATSESVSAFLLLILLLSTLFKKLCLLCRQYLLLALWKSYETNFLSCSFSFLMFAVSSSWPVNRFQFVSLFWSHAVKAEAVFEYLAVSQATLSARLAWRPSAWQGSRPRPTGWASSPVPASSEDVDSGNHGKGKHA